MLGLEIDSSCQCNALFWFWSAWKVPIALLDTPVLDMHSLKGFLLPSSELYPAVHKCLRGGTQTGGACVPETQT